MKEIDLFLERLPLDKGTFPAATAKLKSKYASILPKFVLDVWKAHGFCSFGDGWIWMVNPDDLAPVLPKLGSRFKGAVAVLRSGIGTVFFFKKKEYFYFCPVERKVYSLEDNPLENIMNFSISNKSSAKELYEKPLYDKALKRLGRPAHDECFAFVPPVAMGGDGSVKSLQKVKLKEQLLLLTQLG